MLKLVTVKERAWTKYLHKMSFKEQSLPHPCFLDHKYNCLTLNLDGDVCKDSDTNLFYSFRKR